MRVCPHCKRHFDDEMMVCPHDGAETETDEESDPLIGQTVSSYQVTKRLGKGGMGAVYAAIHPSIGSKVAIKVLHERFSKDAKIVDRFWNEARAVNMIGHDNILHIVDFNQLQDGSHYLVMEYLDGYPLQALLKNEPIPLAVTGPLLVQACDALDAAHASGIVHRDLKPDNIFLINRNRRKHFVKIVDFGIAKLRPELSNTGQTATGVVMGTPAYMSPEQAAGRTSEIDGRSDIYSLGVIMFQLATGRLPFPGQSFGEVLIGHLQQPPPPPRSLAPEIPEPYEAIILKCLAKDPKDRYQSMHELHETILAVMQTLGVKNELPPADAVVPGGGPGHATPRPTPFPGGRGSRPSLTPAPGQLSRPGTAPQRAPTGAPRTPAPRPTSNPDAATISRPGEARTKMLGGDGSDARTKMLNSDGGGSEARTQMLDDEGMAPASGGPMKQIIIGAVAAFVVVGGVVAFIVTSKAEPELPPAVPDKGAVAVHPPAPAPGATAPAVPAPAAPSAPAMVSMTVISDPVGAEVEAIFGGEKKSLGRAPAGLKLEKGRQVVINLTLSGYRPGQYIGMAEKDDQIVSVKLEKIPVAAAPRPERPEKKQQPKNVGEGTLDIDL